MIEQQIEIATRDGSTTTFICHPERGGPHPAVIFLMDAPGIREELRDMVRRLASVGYFIVLPNLYYRSGVTELGPDAMVRDSTGRSRISPLVESLSISLIMSDADGLMRFLENSKQVRKGPMGVIGYCLSGQYAINCAARFPQRVAAAASIYGTSLVTDSPDSPHVQALKAKAALYFACAEIDPWVPAEKVEALRGSLAAEGDRIEVEVYAGGTHGFAFPSRPAYDRAAAERHWERIFELLLRNVPPLQ
jgi:carboxymethylenebutenolidase